MISYGHHVPIIDTIESVQTVGSKMKSNTLGLKNGYKDPQHADLYTFSNSDVIFLASNTKL